MYSKWMLLLCLGCLNLFGGCSTTGNLDLPAPGGVANGNIQVRGQDFEDDEGIRINWSPKNVFNRAKNAAGKGPDRSVAKELYDEADALFREVVSTKQSGRRKQLLSAAKTFDKAAKRWPESSIEEDSLFMKAECYFFADHYPEATEAYDLLVKKYENTRYMDTLAARRFSIANYWIKHHEKNPEFLLKPNLTDDGRPLFDKFGHAVRALDKIRLQDPTGKLADDATMRAAVAHFEQGRFLRADELFDDLRRSFPSSDHQFMAHLFGVKCKLKIYQGPQYSLNPMEESEKLIRQIRLQFPQEAQEHMEFLESAWRETRKNKALHDWAVAKYYDNRKDYGAARYYYQKIVQNYSDTSLADDASERMAKISGRPDKPKQKLPWLAKLFPTPEREKPLVATNPLDKLRR